MLHVLALLAATSVDPIVSTDWLQAHLNDPEVRVIFTGDRGTYDGGIALWEAEKRATSKTAPPAGTGRLTVRPAPDVMVDAAWVRGHLQSPSVRILDVRTDDEWNQGHLPGATLVYWQDLFADRRA